MSPPSKLAKNNRMNPQGNFPCFMARYIKKLLFRRFGIIWMINLTIYFRRIWDNQRVEHNRLMQYSYTRFLDGRKWGLAKYSFLRSFHNEISKPVNPNDEATEYIPTQVFSEYLRHIQKTDDGKNMMGLFIRVL